jgi:hypothetical protein
VSGSAPCKSRPARMHPTITGAAAPQAKTSVKLEPVKFEPLPLQPFPSKSSWKRDIAIRVPRVPAAMLGGPYGSGRPFPSPTDMDMMLLENDVMASNFAPPLLSAQEVDSLDWIDNFLPSLEGNTVNVSAGALLRQAPNYLF